MKRWQYYGIALSVFWILLTTAYIRYQELPKAKEYAMHTYYACTERRAAQGLQGIDPCLQNVSKDWDSWMNSKWGDIAAVALLPAVIGWLVAFGAIHFSQRKRKPG